MSAILRLLLLIVAGLAAAGLFVRLNQPPAIEPPEVTPRVLPTPVRPPAPPPPSSAPPPSEQPPQLRRPSKATEDKPPVPPPLPAEAPKGAQEGPPLPPPPSPPAEPALSEREFYERLSPAVIQIFCSTTEELFSASGVILNARGLVLTNAHVAEIVAKVGGQHCQARHGNPADPFAGLDIVYTASTSAPIANTKVPQRDIAFLRLLTPREPFSAAPLEGRAIAVGETLRTLGYPSEFLESISASNNSNLVFSALRLDGYADLDGDPTNAEGYVFKGGLALQQGSSGTAIFTPSGKVAGLIFATTKGATTAEREGIALTIGYINRVLELETGQGLAEFVESH